MTAGLPSTFAEAERMRPFDLARIWGNVLTWPVVGRTAQDCLEELAVMSALAYWLERWLPLQVHRAALAGASLEGIAAAAGTAPGAAAAMWQEWADRQVRHGHLAPLDRAQAAAQLGLRRQ